MHFCNQDFIVSFLQASVAYQRLAALLRGEFPPNILPATPSGYLVARIHQLAEGHCMPAFTWNGGGEWKGKSWSPELPTDSALMFYLFASYLAAPQWFFLQASNLVVRPCETRSSSSWLISDPDLVLSFWFSG
jgi:hypothetical protein